MSEPQHCESCDTWGCPGFTTPRATPEPVPALRPERVASEAVRRSALAAIRTDLADIKRKQQEAGE